MRNYLQLDSKVIGDQSAVEAVKVFRKLLCLEAHKIGIPYTAINVPETVTVGDGGIDATVTTSMPLPSEGLICTAISRYQIKAGESFKPWQESAIKKELFGDQPVDRNNLGSAVRKCMVEGGQYCKDQAIGLGVKNLSTWAQELLHAADHRLGNLTEKGQHWRSETVAELGGSILLECLGQSTESDRGGCWDYVAHNAKDTGLQPIQACMDVLKRTCDAVELVLTEAGKISLQKHIEQSAT